MQTSITPSLTPSEVARRVAQVIRLRPERWEQGSWYYTSLNDGQISAAQMLLDLADTGPACKTTGCVAGWTAAFSVPEEAIFIAGEGVQTVEGRRLGRVSTLAQEALGLDIDQANYLFDAYRSRENVLRVLDAIADGQPWDVVYDDDDPEDDDDDDDDEEED